MSSQNNHKIIDDILYFRMISTYGVETVEKLTKLKIFISGLRGVGIEAAKNIILSGPAQVCLNDDSIVQIQDLGCNFYLKPEHVGKYSRAEASLTQLQELNQYCKVSVHKGKLSAINEDKLAQQKEKIDRYDVLDDYNIVVVTDNYNQEELSNINAYCRSKNKGLIYSGNLGLYGYCFVDFGENHIVDDQDGEQVKSGVIGSISQEEQGVCKMYDDKRHELEDNDCVTFRDVQGMTQLNDKIYRIEVINRYSFRLLNTDTTSFNPFHTSGNVHQIKNTLNVSFKTFADTLANPLHPETQDLNLCDWGKYGVPEQLHQTLRGILRFVRSKGDLPELHSQSDAEEVVRIVKQINKECLDSNLFRADAFDEHLVTNICLFARAQISPLASFWGGIVAQEIVKYTGKFTPLRQWLHYECFEALPAENHTIDRQLVNSRYHDYISIFGKHFQDTLAKQKIFLIGAGSIGSEYIKMFALMGIGLQEEKEKEEKEKENEEKEERNEGSIVVSDDNKIEVSNMNRQFLFKRGMIGLSKAECVCNAGREMNASSNISFLKERVNEASEKVIGDDFWESLDFVVNAVDNLSSKLYVDRKCLWYGKPLFESGTFATKCSSQIIIPHESQAYSDSSDQPEEHLSLHTMTTFPYQIDHIIKQAHQFFEDIIVEGPTKLKQFLEHPITYIEDIMKSNTHTSQTAIIRQLANIQLLSTAYLSQDFKKCILIAKILFVENFYSKIVHLIKSFPHDYVVGGGKLFWSGTKRPPTPIKFDEEEEQHLDFIVSTANIFAYIFGIPYSTDRQFIKATVADLFIPETLYMQSTALTEELEIQENQAIINHLAQELLTLKLPLPQASHSQLRIIHFEKDDNNNYHLDFLTSMVNLRARIYKIKEATKLEVKLIAGKITPTIAATTALISGVVGIEIIKYILKKPQDQMRNSFINLTLPMVIFSETLPPVIQKDTDYDPIYLGPVKTAPNNFTSWDYLLVQGPLTIHGFNDLFATKYQVNINIIQYGRFCIYNSFIQIEKLHEREQFDIGEIIQQLQGEEIPASKKALEIEVSCQNQDGLDVIVPKIKYIRGI